MWYDVDPFTGGIIIPPWELEDTDRPMNAERFKDFSKVSRKFVTLNSNYVFAELSSIIKDTRNNSIKIEINKNKGEFEVCVEYEQEL